MSRLINKTVVITGASKGIGAAAATHLAEVGCNVFLAARSEDAIAAIAEQIKLDGGSAEYRACDVSSWPDVSALIDACIERFGTIDVLVNNAGVIDPISRLSESDPQSWGQAIDINVKGVYHGMRAAIPPMEDAGGGTIINISSGAATGALEGWSHYCSSKAAALSLTKCGDKEYREKGIRVIGLSPGTVATDMQVSIKSSGINPVSQLDPSVHIPPEWVAKAIAFLMTDAADKYCGTDFSLKTEEGRAAVGLG